MRKTVQKNIALAMCLILMTGSASIAGTAPSTAADKKDKDETVYFQLASDGSLTKATVVNALTPIDGKILDNGRYEKINNLSTRTEAIVKEDRVQFEVPSDFSGIFYYEGEVKQAENPWTLKIEYVLDGNPVEAKDLAGKSGKLKMTIQVGPNSKAVTAYADQYTLQVNLALDSERASGIRASGTTIVTLGSEKKINMMVLPKQSKTFVVEADVKDFEMDSITASAVKANIDLDIDTKGAMSGMNQLVEGSDAVEEGLFELQDGLGEMGKGMDIFKTALSQLLANWKTLLSGVELIGSGISQLSGESVKLSQAATMLEQQMQAGQSKNAEIRQLASKMASSQDPAVKQLAAATLGQLELLEKSQQGVSQLSSGLGQYSKGISDLDAQNKTLIEGFKLFGDGFEKLTSQFSVLTDGTAKLTSATGELRGGQKALGKGLVEARKEFEHVTKQLPNIGEESSDAAFKSFVSDKNNPKSVQFVMKTPPVEKVERINAVLIEEKQLNFWERLLKLFGKL